MEGDCHETAMRGHSRPVIDYRDGRYLDKEDQVWSWWILDQGLASKR